MEANQIKLDLYLIIRNVTGWRVVLCKVDGLICEKGATKGYPHVLAVGLEVDDTD